MNVPDGAGRFAPEDYLQKTILKRSANGFDRIAGKRLTFGHLERVLSSSLEVEVVVQLRVVLPALEVRDSSFATGSICIM